MRRFISVIIFASILCLSGCTNDIVSLSNGPESTKSVVQTEETTSIETASNELVQPSQKLSLYPGMISMKVGDSVPVLVLPADSVSWKVDDEAVASVENGMVTALAPGRTSITVSRAGETATMTVQATESGDITMPILYYPYDIPEDLPPENVDEQQETPDTEHKPDAPDNAPVEYTEDIPVEVLKEANPKEYAAVYKIFIDNKQTVTVTTDGIAIPYHYTLKLNAQQTGDGAIGGYRGDMSLQCDIDFSEFSKGAAAMSGNAGFSAFAPILFNLAASDTPEDQKRFLEIYSKSPYKLAPVFPLEYKSSRFNALMSGSGSFDLSVAFGGESAGTQGANSDLLNTNILLISTKSEVWLYLDMAPGARFTGSVYKQLVRVE